MRIFIFAATFLFSAWTVLAAPVRIASIHLHDVNAMVEDVVSLAEHLEVPASPEMLLGQLGGMAMVDDLSGMDLSQPVTVIIGNDEEQPAAPAMVLRFTVSGDGSAYLDGVRAKLPKHEEIRPGVHQFQSEVEEDPVSFYVVLEGNTARAGADLAHMEAMGGELSEAERTALSVMARGASVGLNLPVLNEMMNKQVTSQKKAMEQMKADLEAEGVDTSEMFGKDDPMAGVESMTKMLDGVMSQLASVVLNLDVRRDITLRIHAQAKDGSVAQRVISGMRVPSAKVAGLRDPQALLSGYATMDGWDDIIEPYAEWISSVYKQMGPPMDAMADSYKAALMTMKGVYDGGYNFLVLPPQEDRWLQMMGCYEIQDAERARQANEDMIKLQVEELNQSEDMPVKINYTLEAGEPHAGVDIQSYRVEFDFDEAVMAGAPGALLAFMKNLKYHVAFMERFMVYAVGDVAHLHRMIDYLNSGEEPEVKHVGFDDIAADKVGYWEIDLGKILAAVAEVVGPMGLEGVQAGLRGLTVKEQGGLTSLVRLTREDLTAFKNLSEMFIPKRGAMPEGFDASYYEGEFSDDDADASWDEEVPGDFEEVEE